MGLSRCIRHLVVLGLAAGPVAAQQATDETVLFQDIAHVSGASRYEQDTREAPASITIVTAEEIQRNGYRTLSQALANVRGFDISYDRNYDYVGVRGFTVPGDFNSRVLLLVDGHRLNESVFGSASLGTDGVIDLRMVERIEIVRGPGSSLYGTSALFAVVNIVTRQPRWIQGVEVSASTASYGTNRGSIAAGRRLAGGIEVMGFASMYRSSGQNLSFPGLGTASGSDGDRYDRQFAKATAGDFSLEVGRSWRLKQIPTGSYNTVFDDPRARTEDAYSFALLRYQHGFAGASSAEATVSYDAYTYRGRYPYADGLTTDYGFSRVWSFEGQYLRPLGTRHRLVAGSEVRWNAHQDQGGDNVDSGTVVFRSRRDGIVWALFAQDEWSLAPHLQLSAGLRHDYYDTFGGTTNPRVAVVYARGWSTFKLLYGRAFRAPNAYELDYQDGGLSTKAAGSLRPERLESVEAVFEGTPTSHLQVTATAFSLNLQDLITQVQDPADSLLVYRNLGRARSRGIELETEIRFAGGAAAGASFTLRDVRDPATGFRLPNAERALTTARLSVPAAHDRLRVSLATRYSGPMETFLGTSVPAHVVADLTLVGTLTSGFTASISAYNVFDARYGDPAGTDQVVTVIPQNRRNLRVSVQARF
ncbi:MAG TPA: TonB-dependent receptor [Gemmatimonadales bacterium]|nr:TonB-dependent receptor [Gemmatimonadales bacterium]